MIKTVILLASLLILNSSVYGQIRQGMSSEQLKKEQSKILAKLGKYPKFLEPWKSQTERKVQLLSVTVNASQNRIHLYFNEPLGQVTVRESIIGQWEDLVRETLGKGYEDCRVQLYAKGVPIERFVPNLYRKNISKDPARQAQASNRVPLTQSLERPIFGKGLSYRHIALWPSHGKYYEHTKNAWRWQRPALFGTIEDLNTFEYTYRYLIPMLESAGAVVISPRERDPQPKEMIVDQDRAKIISGNWRSVAGGFGVVEKIKDENPFEQGSHLSSATGGELEYPIAVEDEGEYAVYVSYKADARVNSTVLYTVTHAGGKSSYKVNQRAGQGWIYLGSHWLNKGSKVNLKAEGAATSDAVRVGGGMGSVVRGGEVSGLPRWAEAARYSMQYNGVPASIYAQDSEKEPKDYKDDYKARGDWATWLQQQANVPLDAVVALHTNAGINDSTFGTLTICYTENKKGKYDDGGSKWAARDMADIILYQVVSDIRAKHCAKWTQRSVYDKQYAEISRPQTPAVIVELLSHQNLEDMMYAFDPAFRFDACRAIYKGILKFFSARYGVPYVVQPLAPEALGMRMEDGKLVLSWRGVDDPLEPTAKPTYYKVYERKANGGFDNGVVVRDTKVALPVNRDGVVRSYRVTALNDGGESFATAVLSACFVAKEKGLAMVVDEFNRLSPPDTVSGGLDFSNFMPRVHDYGFVGEQEDFERSSKFIDNDHPGWGASSSRSATIGAVGNPMDNTLTKGGQLVKEGYSYLSSSLKGYDSKQKYAKVVKVSVVKTE